MAKHSVAAGPTTSQILAVMDDPANTIRILVNDAWSARDIESGLASMFRIYTHWVRIEDLLRVMERDGQVQRVFIRGHRINRYRVRGG